MQHRRLDPIGDTSLDSDQRALWDEVAGGSRAAHVAGATELPGPFNPWMHAARPALHAARLGESLRLDCTIDRALQEIAILTVAGHHECEAVASAHRRLWLRLGGEASVAERLTAGDSPDEECLGLDGHVVHEVVMSLLRRHTIDDALYARALSALGAGALVEVTLIVGYYSTVAMTVNAFGVV